MMLSRVAERAYWMGRYMERAENTARIIDVMSQLLLDLPRNTKYGWRALVDITGANAEFAERFNEADERNVARFLLNDPMSPVSVMSSLDAARENARTTREIIPIEAWERINSLYLRAAEFGTGQLSRRRRDEFVRLVIGACQTLTGVLMGSMRHDEGYYFIRIGRNLERADMTTRLVDVGTANLVGTTALPDQAGRDEDADPLTTALWMAILRSMNAYQAYRQSVQDRVNAEDVVAFLLQDTKFPRAVVQCLGSLEECARPLPDPEEVIRSAQLARRRTAEAEIGRLIGQELHRFIDDLQLIIASLHNQIAKSWFLPPPAE